MNIKKASDLIVFLNDHLDPSKGLSEKAKVLQVKDKIEALYIPSIFRKQAILRNSFRGRILQILLCHRSKDELTAKTVKIFKTACEELNRGKNRETCPLLRMRINQIYSEEQCRIPLNWTPSSSIETLQAGKKAQTKKRKAERDARSILRNTDYAQNTGINSEVFRNYLNKSKKNEIDLDLLVDYLERHPNYAASGWKNTLALIREADKFNTSLNSYLSPLSANERNGCRKNCAKTIINKLARLKSGEEWLYCGQFGYSTNSPIKMAQQITSFFKSYGQTGNAASENLPDPTALVEEFIRNTFASVPKGVNLDLPMINALFEDNERIFPGKLANHLPESLKNGLKSWLRQGLLGNLMEFVEDGTFRDISLLVSEQGNNFKTPEQQQAFLQELQDKMIEAVRSLKGQMTGKIDEELSGTINELKQKIPASLIEHLGTDLFSFPLWLKVKKEADETFSLWDYRSGAIYRGIKPSETNEYFFERLLTHQTEPQYSDFRSRREDIDDGLLATFHKYEKTEIPALKESGHSAMAHSLLIAPNFSKELVIFQMLEESFLNISRPFLKGSDPKKLAFTNDDEGKLLQQGIRALLLQAEKIKDLLPADKMAGLLAAQSEINEAVTKQLSKETFTLPENGLKLPVSFLTRIREVISPEQVISAKSAIIWALGEDFEPFINSLIVSLEAIPAPKTNILASRDTLFSVLRSKDRPKGWLRTIIFSTYWKVAIQLLKFISLYQYAPNLAIYRLVSPYIRRVLGKGFDLLPEACQSPLLDVKNWMSKVFSALLSQVLNLLLKGCEKIVLFGVDHAFEKEDADKFALYLKAVRSQDSNFHKAALSYARQLQGIPQIDFHLSDTFTRTKPQELSVAPLDFYSSFSHEIEQKLNPIKPVENLANTNIHDDEPLSSKNLLSTLQTWEKNARTFYPSNNSLHLDIQYVNSKIAGLPYPGTQEGKIWEELSEEDTRACIKFFNDITYKHKNWFKLCPYDADAKYLQQYALSSTCKMLAIIDSISKKLPDTHLEGYKVNIYGILAWIKENGTSIQQPELIHQLEQFCRYFSPDLDLYNLPSIEELNRRASETLFNYDINQSFVITDTHLHFNMEDVKNNWKEFTYFKEILKTPGVKEKFLDSIVKHQNFTENEIQFLLKNLTEDQWLVLLFEEQLIQFDDIYGSCYPLNETYEGLRSLVLFSNELLKENRYFKKLLSEARSETLKSRLRNIFFPEKTKSLFSVDLGVLKKIASHIPLKKQIASLSYVKNQITSLSLVPIRADDPKISRKLINSFTSLNKELSDKKIKRKEISIYDKNPQALIQTKIKKQHVEESLEETANRAKLAEVSSSPSGQILRLLNHYKANKKSLFTKPDDIKFFTKKLFEKFILKQQIEDSPLVVEAIGEFFNECLDYFAHTKHDQENNLIQFEYTALLAYRYCKAYAPEHMKAFTQLRMKFLNFPELQNTRLLQEIHALTFELPEKLSINDQIEAAGAICRASFQKVTGGAISNLDIDEQFYVQYREWLPTIQNLLADPATQGPIISKIFQSQNTFTLPTTGTWTTEDGDTYKLGHLAFTLSNGKIYSEKIVLLQKCFRFLNFQYLKFYLKEDQSYETIDKRFTLSIPCSGKLFLETNYQGTHYQLFKIDNNLSYWVEKNSASHAKMLVLENGNFHSLNRLKRNEEASHAFSMDGEQINDETWHEVDASSVWSQLLPLNQFCPVSKIKCSRQPEKQHIGRIEFPSYDLNFEVKEVGNELQAQSSKFPDYCIAKIQNHPALKKFPSYLLLENSKKEKKVLVPLNNSISTLLWGFVEPSLGALIGPWFNSIIKSLDDSTASGYMEYTIKGGSLSSDNIGACFYLLLLNVCQQNFDGAEKICADIERLGRLKSFPKFSSLVLTILAILPERLSDKIRPMRLRLNAAIRENDLTQKALRGQKIDPAKSSQSQKVDNEKDDNIIPPQFETVISSYGLIRDLTANLQEIDPRNQLRDDQEWFIFLSIKKNLESLIKDISSDKKYVEMILRYYPIDHIIEKFMLPEILANRYRQLKSKYGKEDSLAKKSLNFITDVVKTEPILTKSLNKEVVSLVGGSTCLDYNWDFLPFLKLLETFTINKPKKFTTREIIAFKQKLMNTEIDPDPPLTPQTFNAENVTKYFFSYYTIARSRDKDCQIRRDKLKELLLLNKGGPDSQFKQLTEILDGVCKYPLNFSVLGKNFDLPLNPGKNITPILKEKNQSKNQHIKYSINAFPEQCYTVFPDIPFVEQFPKFYNFFNKIQGDLSRINLLTTTGAFTGENLGKNLLNTMFQNSLIPGLTTLFKPLYVAEKIARNLPAHPAIPLQESVISPPPKNSKSDYLFLNNLDQNFDKISKDLFSIAFEEIVPESRSEDPPLTLESETPTTKLKAVNEDLNHFYDKLQPNTYLKVKSQADLVDLYVSLKKTCSDIDGQVMKERKALLKTINSKYSDAKHPITFDDLLRYFLKGDFRDLGRIMPLPPELYTTLDRAIAEDLVKNTRLQQLKRALGHLEKILEIPGNADSQERAEKLEALANELKNSRTYEFGGKQPLKLVRRFLMFEYLRNISLWSRQVSRLTDLLVDNKGDAVIELLMSLGKSFFCIPTADSYEASRKLENRKLVINLWPASLAPTNIAQISDQSKEIFQQSTNAFTFNRSQTLTAENLHALLVVLLRAFENGETINMTPEDMLSLEHVFVKNLYEMEKGEKVDLESFELLRTILQLISEKGLAIGDEAHEILNEKEELNWPLGPKQRMKNIDSIETCMRKLIENPQVLEMIRTNNQQGLTALYESSLKNKVALELVQDLYPELTPDEKSELVQFITGNCKTLPTRISTHKKYSEFSLIKGQLTQLLPLTLSLTVNVDFGKSNTNDEFAYVGKGNDNISDTSINRIPYEILVKTMVLWLHRGINLNRIKSVLSYLYKQALQESLLHHCPIEKTPSYKSFARLNLPYDLESLVEYPDDKKNLALEKLTLNPHIILLYVRYFITDKITFYKDNIRTNAQVLSSLFNKKYFDTGTPYNAGVYPPELKMLYDEGTLGEALHLLNKKCPPDGIHLLKSTLPKDILAETLRNFFRHGSGFTSIIDGGAQLTGLSNLKVVEQMRSFVKANRPDIKGIDFFLKDAEGNDKLMTYPIDADAPIPYDQCHLDLNERLAYFDQSHGFGANIPQNYKGKGLLLLSPQHRLFKFVQEGFRMRGIKNILKLLNQGGEVKTPEELDALNQSNTQSVHIALTPQAQSALPKDPTLKDIFNLCIVNEDKQIKQSNYNAYVKKVDNAIRSAIRKKIIYARSNETRLDYFREFRDFFIQRSENDPINLYGLLDSDEDVKIVIKAKQDHAFGLIETPSLFSQEEKEGLKNEILKIPLPPFPDRVHVFTDGKGKISDKNEDAGKNTAVATDTQNESEVAVEQQQATATKIALPKIKVSNFKEWPWSEEVSSSKMDWLTFSSAIERTTSLISSALSGLSSMIFGKAKNEQNALTPPLFCLRDLLEAHPNSNFKKIVPSFDKRIWLSNNFLPRYTNSASEIPVNVGERGQRNLHQVLVHMEETKDSQKILSAGCLSIEDAEFWSKKLKNKNIESNDSSSRVFLYDPGLRTIAAGDQIDLNRLLENSDFIENIECPLKFINGDVHYDIEQLPSLAKWLKAGNPEVMAECFQHIHDQRGIVPFAGSVIDLTFKTLAT